jgi:sulfoxide reductase heme-binding subunit YedZ
VLAFALLTMSVLLGLSGRSRVTDPLVHRGWIYEFHQTLSVAGLVTIVGHVALILMNRHVHFGLGGVLVPFASEWRPWATSAGILGLYLTVALVASSYLRPTLGLAAWRTLHYASFIAWVAALAHAFLAGTDSHRTWMLWVYALSAQAVLILIVYRIIVGLPVKRRGVEGPARG